VGETNLNLRLPHVAPDVLTLSRGNVSEVANPGSAAASGNGTAADESGIMSRAFGSYQDVLKSEVYMFSVFLGAYAPFVLSAIVIMIFKSKRNASPAPSAEREMSEKSAPNHKQCRRLLLHE